MFERNLETTSSPTEEHFLFEAVFRVWQTGKQVQFVFQPTQAEVLNGCCGLEQLCRTGDLEQIFRCCIQALDLILLVQPNQGKGQLLDQFNIIKRVRQSIHFRTSKRSAMGLAMNNPMLAQVPESIPSRDQFMPHCLNPTRQRNLAMENSLQHHGDSLSSFLDRLK